MHHKIRHFGINKLFQQIDEKYAHLLQKWKEAFESKFENDQEAQEKLHERKQGLKKEKRD